MGRREVVEASVENLLVDLGVDIEDANFVETPRRVANYLMGKFLSEGELDAEKQKLKDKVFPTKYQGMVVVGPTTCSGMCPHHLLPVLYRIYQGYIPSEKVWGLSKLPRVAQLYAEQAKLQEDVTQLIAEAMMDCLSTEHVAVVVEGQHMCMCVRGVKQPNAITTTSYMGGHFLLNEGGSKTEFFGTISKG